MGVMLQDLARRLGWGENHGGGEKTHKFTSVEAEFRARATAVGACHG